MAEFGLSRLLQSAVALCRGVAGAGRGAACASGPGDLARVRRGRPAGGAARRYSGRRVLAVCGAGAALLFLAQAQAQVASSRLWPAREYTRLTIESHELLSYTIFTVKDPARVVLDLEVSEL